MWGSGMSVINVPRSLVPVKVHGKESGPHLTVKQPNEARKPAQEKWNCELHHSKAKWMWKSLSAGCAQSDLGSTGYKPTMSRPHLQTNKQSQLETKLRGKMDMVTCDCCTCHKMKSEPFWYVCNWKHCNHRCTIATGNYFGRFHCTCRKESEKRSCLFQLGVQVAPELKRLSNFRSFTGRHWVKSSWLIFLKRQFHVSKN